MPSASNFAVERPQSYAKKTSEIQKKNLFSFSFPSAQQLRQSQSYEKTSAEL